MRKLGLVVSIVAMALSAAAVAHPRLSMPEEARALRSAKVIVVRAAVGEPKARIGFAQGDGGLDPLDFAKWLAAHPQLARASGVTLRQTARHTALLNISSPLFLRGDRDADGCISAAELADFVAAQYQNIQTASL